MIKLIGKYFNDVRYLINIGAGTEGVEEGGGAFLPHFIKMG